MLKKKWQQSLFTPRLLKIWGNYKFIWAKQHNYFDSGQIIVVFLSNKTASFQWLFPNFYSLTVKANIN